VWAELLERNHGQARPRPPLAPLEQAREESRFGDRFAVLAQLEAAIELAGRGVLGHLAEAFADALEDLRCSQNPSYDETSVSRELLDGSAYVGLSGPDSPVRCEAPLSGFLIMGANVTYDDHAHGPREIYLVLTPGSQWRLDKGEWFDVAPGDLIFHDTWQMHATRTASQPFLAFVAWLEPGDRKHIEI